MAESASAAASFDELERAVRHLGEELAFFRRRALDAERRARELAAAQAAPAPVPGPPASPAVAAAASGGAAGDPALGARVAALEAENADLRERLREAAERTRALADRVRFVRQQTAADDEELPA